MSDNEVSDYDNLLKSPGWLRLLQHAKEDWAAQVDGGVAAAANELDDVLALNKLRQVVAAKKAVERLLAWPAERMRTLSGQTVTTTGVTSSINPRFPYQNDWTTRGGV